MKKILLALTLISCTTLLFSQTDSLILTNGDVIVGDLKSMDRGVATIETDYSDSDFTVTWEKIQTVKTNQRYLITLSDGKRINGNFESNGDGKMKITSDEGEVTVVGANDIVNFFGVDDSFGSRISANIDINYSITKANNQSQLTGAARVGYQADRWSTNVYYNGLISSQDSVEDIRRNEYGLGFRYFLPKDWYLSLDVGFLSNTEQALKLRINTRLGVGKYFIHTNSANVGLSIGAAQNQETYYDPEQGTSVILEEKSSFEGFIGLEADLYDVGDLTWYSNVVAYPSFTEQGRWRVDFNMNAKYDDFILKDFYIKAGLTINYDNQPVVVGNDLDYVFTTGFGWEW